MTWDEIDLAKADWIIPTERMKAWREHRVPMTCDAVGILKSLPQSGETVFPAPKGGPLSVMTLAAVHKRMEIDATVHGWRSTFKDWTAERRIGIQGRRIVFGTEVAGPVVETALTANLWEGRGQ